MSANENFTASDRELLKSAAKAAGHLVDQEISTDKWLYINPDANGDQEPWNPLTDDAQALRLAVKVDAWPVRGRAVPGDWSRSNFIRVVIDGVRVDEVFTTDPYAATRRAIVRAAASIGAAL